MDFITKLHKWIPLGHLNFHFRFEIFDIGCGCWSWTRRPFFFPTIYNTMILNLKSKITANSGTATIMYFRFVEQ